VRSPQLTAPAPVAVAGAAAVRALTALIKTLNDQVAVLDGQVRELFGMHPDAEIIASQPGLGPVLGARVLAEFGDDPNWYASAKARKNYAGTSPITRRSGKSKYVMARYVHNDRLRDALRMQAFVALGQSPGARGYYDALRARGLGHEAALRQLASRLVGILHGCLKTRSCYDETIAWPQYQTPAA
jgi:transposase